MYENRRDGDLLMDVPETDEWEELRAMATAGKGKVWQKLVRQIKDMVHIQTAKEKSGSKKRKQQKKRKTKKKKKKANGSDAEAGASSAAASATARREEDDEDSEDEDGGWVIKRVAHKKVQPQIRCRDGFRVSVQASRDHFCTPRDDHGPCTHVEVGYPSEWEDLLLPCTDNNTTCVMIVHNCRQFINVSSSFYHECIGRNYLI